MFPVLIPLFYQLIQAYQPVNFVAPPSPTPIPLSPTPTPKPMLNAKTNYTIAIIGDSMIDTLKSNLPQLQASLHAYLPIYRFKLLNYGYGSSTITSAIDRITSTTTYLDHDNPSIISQNPDLIVIESFAYNNFGNTPTSLDRYRQAISDLIASIHDHLPRTKILLAATFAPNSTVFADGVKDLELTSADKTERSSTIKTYLDAFITYAHDHSLPLADAYHPSLFSDNGFRSFISSDGIHPSDYGAQFFCDILAQSITQQHLLQ